jgi:Domain of unknown function (DUF3883)
MVEEPAITTLPATPPESDFGQEYSLLKALNKLVRDYSLGVSLFKEFIQNADDAEATEIRFILDQTSQASRVFHNPKLAQLVGPALLAWNNASFKDQDIKNIRSLGDTEKVLKPASTGKFGLGFNTCYNVTDYPLLLTGPNIYLFDPHKTAYDYSESAPPGKCWPLSSQLWSTSSDLLSPFQPLGLSPNQSEFPGTAFRLPLRTSDHDGINGQIKRGPVSPDKIQELFQGFTRFAPSILLFLKHLLRIEFLVLTTPGAAPSSVLIIETLNQDTVTTSRGIVNCAIKTDIPATLQNLRSQVGDSITCCFQHSLKVTHRDKPTTHDWLVCAGLFRGPDDTLLKAATELWDRREKAIPWAGCACPLPAPGKAPLENFQGHVFCFLPLPDALGACRLPVHINGFFDVDTSRKGLTHEASATGSVERLRAEWNRTLIKEAVANAYGKMLLRLIELDPKLDADTFYTLWLDPNQNFPAPLDSLPTALYTKLAHATLLRSAASDWQAPADLRLISPALRPPLVAEKWSKIPDPEIPAHICDGFAQSKKPISSLKSSELRAFIETSADIRCSLAECPRPALQKREWLIAVAKLALTKAPPAALPNLPLLLLADGTLHTIGHRSSPAYLAGEAERKIFARFPDWFVDADYAEAVCFPEAPAAKVLNMNPDHVLTQLALILPKAPDKSFATWTPNAQEPPNEEWLNSVFQFFLDQPPTWKPSDDLVSKPCLVPDQHHQLWPTGNNLTPLLVSASLDPRLRAALESLDVQLVTGGSKLLQTIESFAGRFSKVWFVTPRDLADTLHESRSVWSAKLLKYDSATCDPILQFFAGKESLEYLAHPTLGRADKLRELPLFPCQNYELVAITGNQCYIAAEVTPPAVTLPTKLLRPGTWKELLVALKLEPLKARAIIQHVLLPNYPRLMQEEQLTALAWIRDHLEEALTEAGADQDSLLSALRSATLVVSSNNVLSECRRLYIPNNKTIRDVLGDLAVTPSHDLYGHNWDRWFPFFDRLGICKTPRPQDLACHMDRLKKIFETKEESGPPPTSDALTAAEQQLVSVLQHIVQNWSSLREGQINLSDGTTILFRDFLRTRTWCPPLRGDKNLKHLLIALEPPVRLFQPTQLYPPILGHLVASLNHLLPIDQRDSIPDAIREIVPEVVTPPVATVTAHFSNLLTALNTNGSTDPKAIKTPLQRIYSYLGQLEAPDSVTVKTAFAMRNCIYVGAENSFRKPKDTFRESVSFATPWWSQAYFGTSEIEAGLTVLGRKDKPDVADLCRLTCEIRQSTTEQLSEKEEAQFIRILVRIEELLPDQDPLPDLCLLDRDGCAVPPRELFFHDATWLDEQLADSPVHLHHPQLPLKLLARLKLRRLSDHIITEPEGVWTGSQNPEFLARCKTIEALLKTSEFLTGLRRILSRSSIATNDLDLDWVSAIHVSAVKSLQCSHQVLDEGKKVLLATSEELYFHPPPESGDHTLTLSEAGVDVLYEQVAGALQHWIGAEDLQDLSPLTKILQCAPDRIESILDKLRVRRFDDNQATTEEEKRSDEGRSTFFDDNGPEKSPEGSEEAKKQPGGDGNQQSQPGGQPQGGQSQQQTGGSGKSGEQTGSQSQQTGGSGRQGGGQGAGGGSPRSGQRRSGRRTTGAARTEQKPKGRLLSYAATEAQRQRAEREEDNADDELRPNREIGDWAVHWVLQYERSQGRNPDPSNHIQNKPGFDVLCSAKALQQPRPRYIEVKGIDGDWDVNGVPLYPAQMDFARQHGDDFWLYVVEHAREPDKIKIHTIQNPAQKITQHRFDSGWKTVAAPPNTFKPNVPRVGSRIQWYQDGQLRAGRVAATGTVLQVDVENQLHTRIGIANRPLQFEVL